MTLRELLKKPFWSPSDLSIFTGMSVSASRRLIYLVRQSIEDRGLININKSKAPVKEIVLMLGIDLNWLSDTGVLDRKIDFSKGAGMYDKDV